MNYINRIIEKEVIKASKNYPVVMVCGQRQVDKLSYKEKDNNGLFWLTGAQKFKMMKNIQE